MAYHHFKSEEGEDYGSFEVFYMDKQALLAAEWARVNENTGTLEPTGEGQPFEPGWYWWACFPGCLPDGEAMGPFETEEEAQTNALEW
jgi:hypothetical protein